MVEHDSLKTDNLGIFVVPIHHSTKCMTDLTN